MKTLFIFLYSRIVPHGDFIVPEFPSFLGKEVEFDKVVTEYIRIRGNSPLISVIDVLNYTFFIGFPVVKSKKRNIEIFCYFSGNLDVCFRRTCSIICQIVNHKTRMNFVSRLLKQECGNRRIDASREAYKDFHVGVFEIVYQMESKGFYGVVNFRMWTTADGTSS